MKWFRNELSENRIFILTLVTLNFFLMVEGRNFVYAYQVHEQKEVRLKEISELLDIPVEKLRPDHEMLFESIEKLFLGEKEPVKEAGLKRFREVLKKHEEQLVANPYLPQIEAVKREHAVYRIEGVVNDLLLLTELQGDNAPSQRALLRNLNQALQDDLSLPKSEGLPAKAQAKMAAFQAKLDRLFESVRPIVAETQSPDMKGTLAQKIGQLRLTQSIDTKRSVRRPRHSERPLPLQRVERKARIEEVGIATAKSTELSPVISPDRPVPRIPSKEGIAPEILALAEDLGYSPARIFRFVHDSIGLDPKWGSFTGSLGTLWARSGTSWDQALLLRDLLAAAGVDARLEWGEVEISTETLVNLAGVSNPVRAGDLLTTAGIPIVLFTQGSQVVGARLSHVWVKAYLDYIPDRGATAGPGDTWVHMDPSFTRIDYAPGLHIHDQVPFSLGDYLLSGTELSPLRAYQDALWAYIRANDMTCTTLEQLKPVASVRQESFPFVPGTLHAKILRVDGEATSVPAAFTETLEVALRTAAGTPLLTWSASVPATYAQRLELGWRGATADDQATLDAMGGVFETPPYLVDLMPVVLLDGVEQATGSAIGSAEEVEITVTLRPANGTADVFVHGGYSGEPGVLVTAFGPVPQQMVSRHQEAQAAAAEAGDAADIETATLQLLGTTYFQNLGRDLDDVAGWTWHRLLRLVSEGLVVQTGNVTTAVDGSPLTFTKAETFVDFPGFAVGLFHATGTPGNARPTLELAGAQGSFLEGEVFNQVAAREGIAAVTALTRARREGQTVERVDAANLETVLAVLDLGQDVEVQVRRAVDQGRVAWIPEALITVNQWRGVGFVLSDPTTGAGGYLLNGGFAGGADTGTLTEAFEDVLGDEAWLSDGAFGELFGSLRALLGAGPADETAPETNYGDPINLATGNLWVTENDLFIIARGLPIVWSRTYNSRSTLNGPLGYGWTFELGESLETATDGSVLYREPDGSEHRFALKTDGAFSRPAGKHLDLKTDTGGFTLREKDGTVHRFDLSGRLTSLVDRNQNQLQLTYGADGLLSTVIDAAGRTALTVTTDGSKIQAVEDITGRRVEYTYEGDDLAAVRDASGEIWTFQYDGDHNLVSRGNPLGEMESYAFDTLDRCIAHTDPLGATETYHYAQRGESAVVTDRRGYSSYLAFDETGRAVLQVDPLGNAARSTWDADNNRLTTVDPRGGVTAQTYDEQGNLLTHTDALGNTTTATYEPEFSHRLTVTDALGQTLENAFDKRGNLVETSRTVDGDRLTQNFGYDENGQVAEIRDFVGSVTSLEWNSSQGTLDFLTNALDQTVLFEYDTLGRIERIADPLDNTMQFVWDPRSSLSAFVDPYGNQQSFEYDAAGRRTASITPLGRSITEYDAAGRAVREVDVQGNAFVREYDAAGNMITEIDPMGNRWSMTYDALGRLMSRINPLGQIWTVDYCAEILAGSGFSSCGAGGCQTGAGAEGGFCRLVDPLGNVIEQEHDVLGRVTSTTGPLGNTIRTVYDALGRKSAVADAMGNSTAFKYDAVGRLAAVVEADDSRTLYEYDPNGNLLKAVDAEGHETSWAYDALNRKVSETDPLGNITEFHYDAINNLINKRTANGDVITYDYDFKRLLSVQVPGETPEQFVYSQLGQRIEMKSKEVSLEFSYDNLGRLTQATDHKVGQNITYRYDALGRDRERDDPRGTVKIFRDALGRVIEQRDPRHGTFRFRYDELGRREIVEYPNGLVSRYTYDGASRLESVIVFNRASEVVDGYRYTYDGNSRRTSMTSLRDNVVHQYDYDVRGNLVRWQRSPDEFEAYTYDRAGNRLVKEAPDRSTSYEYDAANQLLKSVTQFVDGAEIRTNYQWNADGTLAEKTTGTDTTDYQWDPRGRLLRLSSNSTLVSYGYDPLGIRVSEADADGIRRFLHSKGEIVGVYEDDTEITSYSHGPGVDEVLAQRSNGTVSYLHHDGLGSVAALSNVQGELAGTVRYAAFGEVEVSDGVASRFGFTGREVDSTDLMYYRSRYLDPSIGRFLSRDVEPLRAHKPATLHRYSYVENDPINNVDPTGRITASWAAKVIGSFLLGAVAGIGLGKLLKVTGPQRGRDHLLGNFALGMFITILSMLILLVPLALFSSALLLAILSTAQFLAGGGAILVCNFPGIVHEIMIYSGDWPLDLMENFIGCSLGYLVGLTFVIASPAPVIAFLLGTAVGYALVIQDLL